MILWEIVDAAEVVQRLYYGRNQHFVLAVIFIILRVGGIIAILFHFYNCRMLPGSQEKCSEFLAYQILFWLFTRTLGSIRWLPKNYSQLLFLTTSSKTISDRDITYSKYLALWCLPTKPNNTTWEGSLIKYELIDTIIRSQLNSASL